MNDALGWKTMTVIKHVIYRMSVFKTNKENKTNSQVNRETGRLKQYLKQIKAPNLPIPFFLL